MEKPTSNALHVIFGTGPVGCWIAKVLRKLNIPVRAVNRSGRRPNLIPTDVEIIATDASDTTKAIVAAEGTSVIYQALNPPYHQWHKYFPGLQTGALAAAKATGARYVSIENLYMYDSSKPINEDSPIAPRSKKGQLRARMADELMTAHERGDIHVAVLRSSDYYGPGVLGSALGEMVFGNLVSGKKAQVSGSADMPHSFAYVEDVAQAAAILGTHEASFGKVWIAPHAPALTQREIVEKICRVLNIKAQMTVVSPLMMRIVGLFIAGARASVEMMYAFTEPFVVDSNRIQQTFALEPTPVDVGIERTVSWYKKIANKK
ncbi:MAG: NAD-dependent epimerase/dehydratase family protein [bacterium]